MRIGFSRRGISISDRFGRFVRRPWYQLAPFVVTPLVFAILLALAINRNVNFARMLRNYPADGLSLYEEFSRTSIENLLAVEPAPVESQLPTLELFVPKNTLMAMHRAKVSGDVELGHEPGGDRPYFRAYFRDESGVLQKAKISYRGLMNYHHWPDKPSLRVRIKKAHIARGQRYVELTRAKDTLALRNQIPEYLADHLGIVTTQNDPVRLFVNRKYFGVYLRSTRPGEALALANGRMPGTFFKGDCVGADEHLDLWETSKNWKMFGEIADADVARFDAFLDTLREPPSIASAVRLQELLDAERFAKWSAVMIATGCVHTDAKHNQTYFFCANQGKLEIMPWDPTCYEIAGRDLTPVDTVNHPVTDRMIRDPRWVHRRNQFVYELITGPASAAEMHRHVEAELALRIRDLRADTSLSKKRTIGEGRVPCSIWDIDDELAEIKDWAIVKEKALLAYLDDARVYAHPDPDRPGEALVQVFGHVAVRVSHRDGKQLVARDAAGGVTELLYPGLYEELPVATFNPHGIEKKLPYAAPAPLVYRVAAPAEMLEFHNAVTGKPVAPQPEGVARQGDLRTLAPSQFPVEPTGQIVLGPGTLVLGEDLHVGRRQELVIQPGTTIRLQPGVGIYARGRVVARGTAEAGIRIEPAGDSPWAAFGVTGPEAAGSEFHYVSVAGGSIGQEQGLRYKGMFNVYNCPQVAIRHCYFGVNHVGDDAVNLAESRIEVEDSTFVGARSDGLDLDMCRGVIRRCRWERTGNDGLDMMSCRMRVLDCEFEACGDKGISVGEGTEVLVRDCRITTCVIGIEAKDASRIVAERVLLDGNGLGYHSYRKKWLYSRGGRGLLVDCKFSGSREATVGLAAKSKLWLLRTPVAVVKQGSKRLQHVEAIEPAWQSLIADLETL